jgi:hypothetical protein
MDIHLSENPGEFGCKSVKNTWRSVEPVRRPLPLFENILDMDFIEDSEGVRVVGGSEEEGVCMFIVFINMSL